jgi:tryptophan-rich sensory protein
LQQPLQDTRAKGSALPALGLFVLGCVAIGWLGGIVTQTSIDTWYPTLAKPSWTPPNWAFPVAWTILYAMMGAAASLVWRSARPGRRLWPLILFAVQLALNVVWTSLFFGLRSPGLAVIDIVLLVLAIVVTIVAFWRVRPAAGWLLLPYLAWVAYATTLNFAIWQANS